MLGTGDHAPDFSLEDQAGNTVSLSDFLKNGALVLYFYPADFTPGCTKEACDIRDLHGEIADAGLQVVGVSPQDTKSHRRFADRFKLPFTLLADPAKKAIKAYGVDGPLGLGVRRATFLIDASGVIEDVVLADLLIGRHKGFIERAISKAE